VKSRVYIMKRHDKNVKCTWNYIPVGAHATTMVTVRKKRKEKKTDRPRIREVLLLFFLLVFPFSVYVVSNYLFTIFFGFFIRRKSYEKKKIQLFGFFYFFSLVGVIPSRTEGANGWRLLELAFLRQI
jgi:hypothetical protein